MERHRAVLTGADGDAAAIEDLSEVVGVDAVDGEADDTAVLVGRSGEETHARDRGQAGLRRGDKLLLVGGDRVPVEFGEELDGGAQSDGLGDGGCSGLEFVRQLVPLGAIAMDFEHHIAAAEDRRHRFEPLAAAVEDADTRRAEHLVARERGEIDPQGGDVERAVGNELRGVEKGGGTDSLGTRDNLGDRQQSAEDIGHARKGDQAGAGADLAVEGVEIERAVRMKFRVTQHDSALAGQHQPGDKVGVVFEGGQDDLVAGLKAGAAEGESDQVDRLRSPAGEDDLGFVAGVDVAGDRRAGFLVGGGCFLAEGVEAAVDVGGEFGVVGLDGPNDRPGLEAGGSVVEIDQRNSGPNLAGQHRKTRADRPGIKRGRDLGRDDRGR